VAGWSLACKRCNKAQALMQGLVFRE